MSKTTKTEVLARVIALAIAEGDKEKADEIIAWASGGEPMATPKEPKQRDGTPLFIRKYLKPSAGGNWERIEQFINRCIIKKPKNVDFEVVSKKILNMPYKEFLTTPYWKGIAMFVKRRDGWRCTECGSTKDLDVHHKTYGNHGNEINSIGDLTTLCRNCHQRAHGNGNTDENSTTQTTMRRKPKAGSALSMADIIAETR